MAHKDIYHRKCGKRMPDKGEQRVGTKSKERGDELCTCPVNNSSMFTSRPNPPDLQFYDKYLK